MKKIKYITLLLCLIAGFSCAVDEECRTNLVVSLGLGLYHATYIDSTKTTTIAAGSIDSLTIKGLKLDTVTGKYVFLDSILYNNSKAVSKIYLPLHKFELMSMYEITFDKIKDTLTVLHQNANDYISLDCGCIKVHSIDTAFITKHFVDSIHIINHKVNNINAEHIKIFK